MAQNGYTPGLPYRMVLLLVGPQTPAFLTRAHRPQALPGVKPGLVAVVPDELEGVLAGGFEPEVVPLPQSRSPEKVRVRERAHVFMAPAGGARTGAAQPVERLDGAVAVRPTDRFDG